MKTASDKPRLRIGHLFDGESFGYVIVPLVLFLVSMPIGIAIDVITSDSSVDTNRFRHDFYNALQNHREAYRYDYPDARRLGTWLRQFPKEKQMKLMSIVHEVTIDAKGLSNESRDKFSAAMVAQYPQAKTLLLGLTNEHFWQIAAESENDAILRHILDDGIIDVAWAMQREGRRFENPFKEIMIFPIWLALLQLAGVVYLLVTYSYFETTGRYERQRKRFPHDAHQRSDFDPYWCDFDWKRISTYVMFLLLSPFGTALLLVCYIATGIIVWQNRPRDRQAKPQPSNGNEFDPQDASRSSRQVLDSVEQLLRGAQKDFERRRTYIKEGER